jgi:hypothetical protein
MKRLGSYVNKTVRSLKAGEAIRLHQLKSAWLTAVGQFMGTQTEPVKVKGDTLFLIVSSPLWAQEVKLQQRLIIKKLQGTLSKPPKKITCWVGDPHAKKSRPHAEEEEDEAELVPWKTLSIPPDRMAKIEQTVSSIEDANLQDKMRKLLELSVQRELYLLDKGQLPCPICGNFRPPEEEMCASCTRERQEFEERKVFRLLAQKPWLTARDVAERTPLKGRALFMRIRKQLLADLMLQAWQRTSGLEGDELIESMDQELRTLLLDITMLRCSLAVHSLKPKHFYFALGKRLAKGYLEED